MTTWVIGQGGLLGSAIIRKIRQSSTEDDLFVPCPIPWSSPRAPDCLTDEYRRFREQTGGGAWRILWAAGAATVSSSRDTAMAELGPLESLLTAIRTHPPRSDGLFFLTSSAGGVFAGSQNPPFTESSLPAPLGPYGELKLKQEVRTATELSATCRVVIGRFSNLYGPGQNLDKLQGLISRLALAAINQQPISIFVPLDTIRDYIYVDDAAAAALTQTENPQGQSGSSTRTVIIASGQPPTIVQVIHMMGHVTRRRIPVAHGSHPSAGAQALDLRLTPSKGVYATTHLPEGMKAAYQDILTRVQDSQAAAHQP